MTFCLTEVFPDLLKKQQHFFCQEQFQKMPYFSQIGQFLPQKQVSLAIRKSKKLFKLLNIKKGTIITLAGRLAQSGYILCHGSIELLCKKNNRQKQQNFANHLLYQQQEKIMFLNQKYGIPLQKCQPLLNEFYQEKVLFKYLTQRLFYQTGHFGFGQMLKNSLYYYTAIATQNCVLLEIEKEAFQTSLKQFQLKKEDFLINQMISHKKSDQQGKQIKSKLATVLASSSIIKLQKNQTVYEQGQYSRGIWFILKGEVQLTKKVKIDIPKKLLSNQNKSCFEKQISIKVTRVSQKSFFGETQIFLNLKSRQFTIKVVQNQTFLVKIQQGSFLKFIGQFPLFEKEINTSSRQKYNLAIQSYLNQKKKITQAFLLQFQAIQNKNKQKLIGHLLTDEQNKHRPEAFQVFSKQGIFYRDTYQKLQGFDQFQSNNKPKAIKKFKLQGSIKKQGSSSNGKDFEQKHDLLQEVDSVQKFLHSPQKNIKIFQFIGQNLSLQGSPNKNRQSLKSSQIVRMSPSKFQQLKKDEKIFKRVLIKNGKYQIQKKMDKTNIAKPIVNHKFDEIIKQCMSRKNQVIRKAIYDKNDLIVRESFHQSIKNLKDKSVSISKFSQFSTACRGTQQLKQRMKNFKKQKRSQSSEGIRYKIDTKGLEQCIGINLPPKSSQIKNRSKYIREMSTGDGKRSDKLVLLNHMMKPITYSSVQL